MKYIKSNIGFIISMLILAVIALNPQLKGLVMRGLLKTGFYNPSTEPPEALSSSRKVPAISFVSSSGEQIDISEPGKVVFLNFWATWCPPCIAEMPSIQALKNKFDSKDVSFVMVDVDNNLQKAQDFMKKHGYNFEVFLQTSSIPESIFKGTLPTTLIINQTGETVFYHEGMADYNSPEMVKLLNSLLR